MLIVGIQGAKSGLSGRQEHSSTRRRIRSTNVLFAVICSPLKIVSAGKAIFRPHTARGYFTYCSVKTAVSFSSRTSVMRRTAASSIFVDVAVSTCSAVVLRCIVPRHDIKLLGVRKVHLRRLICGLCVLENRCIGV